jgi:LacI family transcriptional regulator
MLFLTCRENACSFLRKRCNWVFVLFTIIFRYFVGNFRMKKIGLIQLAKELGVSVSTVSKALRGSYEIGSDTTKKVQEMADRMGYRASPYAGHLRNHRSKTIAIIIPEMTNNFFVQAITGAESVVREKGYHTLVYATHDDYDTEVSITKHLQSGRVDGVIMSISESTKNYNHLNELTESNIPIVFFDNICHEIETAKVITNDFSSGFNATEHLIKRGCKNIAYLSMSGHLSTINKRKQGYLEALNKYDIKAGPGLIVNCGLDDAANYRIIKRLLSKTNRPEGIFASIESLALSTYQVCNDMKISIPGELKVIGFSNLKIAGLLNPSLSTITQPALEMGKQAAAVLCKHLDKKRKDIPNENIIIKSELVVRDSTRMETRVK